MLRLVHLTKTAKRGRGSKELLISKIRDLCRTYSHIYIIRTENERNQLLKDVRKARDGDVFVFGGNRVIAKALGADEQSECQPGQHALAKRMAGHVGLMFSRSGPDEVVPFFSSLECTDYARCGTTAQQDVSLPKGQLLKVGGEEIPHYMEEQLRQLGLPTRLDNGKVVLLSDYVVCRKGKQLTAYQARILKHIGLRMAKMTVYATHVWYDGSVWNITEWPSISGDD